MNSFSDIDGWIMAGGTSRRMGEDKASLEIGGRTLIELAGNALSQICEGRISVAGEPREFAQHWPAFSDQYALGLGPISGLLTALSNGKSEWIAVISCDMPFVTGEVFARLADHATFAADAVVPIQPDGRNQPLCALYRRKPVLTAVRALIKTSDRSLHKLLSNITTHFLPFSAFSDLPTADNLFLNINTPADHERAKEIVLNSGF